MPTGADQLFLLYMLYNVVQCQPHWQGTCAAVIRRVAAAVARNRLQPPRQQEQRCRMHTAARLHGRVQHSMMGKRSACSMCMAEGQCRSLSLSAAVPMQPASHNLPSHEARTAHTATAQQATNKRQKKQGQIRLSHGRVRHVRGRGARCVGNLTRTAAATAGSHAAAARAQADTQHAKGTHNATHGTVGPTAAPCGATMARVPPSPPPGATPQCQCLAHCRTPLPFAAAAVFMHTAECCCSLRLPMPVPSASDGRACALLQWHICPCVCPVWLLEHARGGVDEQASLPGLERDVLQRSRDRACEAARGTSRGREQTADGTAVIEGGGWVVEGFLDTPITHARAGPSPSASRTCKPHPTTSPFNPATHPGGRPSRPQA